MRILIVDDHAIVRDGLSRLLAIDGDHEIKMAASGREALVTARSFRPALTILDLNLPGLGGLELLRRMAQVGAGKILVLSMHAEALYARRSLEAGAHGYVSKNAAPDELMTAVRRELQSRGDRRGAGRVLQDDRQHLHPDQIQARRGPDRRPCAAGDRDRGVLSSAY